MSCLVVQRNAHEFLCTVRDTDFKPTATSSVQQIVINDNCLPEDSLKLDNLARYVTEPCKPKKMKADDSNASEEDCFLSTSCTEDENRKQNEKICAIALVASLKTCAKEKDLNRGKEIHKFVKEKGLLQNNAFLGSALIGMYTNCGALEKAQEVFHSLQMQNVVLWNALITGYTQHGHSWIALNCYEQMQTSGSLPNAVTFVCVLKACGSMGALDKGMEVHDQILQDQSSRNNVWVANALIDMYAKCGALEKAQEVFDNHMFKDVVSWTALIAGYAQHALYEAALVHFNRMQCAGILPDAATFACALKASGSKGALDIGHNIHSQIVKQHLLETNFVVANAVIAMYAKCGALEDAKQVFDGLVRLNTVSWNALISGLAQHGQEEEALHLFKCMQLRGFLPDAVTFACILKVCGNLGALNMGEEIHSQILRERLIDKDIVVGNSLVDMYAKCGELEKASEVFDQLPDQDVVSWNALIAGYAQYGHSEQAVKYFHDMRLRGFHPNAVTLTCMMKVCLSDGDLKTGQEIHAQIIREQLEKDVIVANAILEMYSRCGLLGRACELFDDLSDRNAASWTALIVGYCHHAQHGEALYVFRQMQLGGFPLVAVTVPCIFQACGSLRSLDQGCKIHDQIVKEGVWEEDNVIGNAVMDMYVKCDSLEEAQVVFDNLDSQDRVSWNILVAGYTENGHANAALECFKQMQEAGMSPDSATFACVLKACATLENLQQGQQIHLHLLKQYVLNNDIVLASAIVTMYAQCGALQEAQKVFDELSSWSVVSWTALISGYAQHGFMKEALGCFEQMQHQGFSPNAVTLACLLRACGNIGAAYKAGKLLNKLEENESLEDGTNLNVVMVGMYAKCGMLAQAQEFFRKIKVHDVVSWTSILGCYAQLGKDEDVFRLFNCMLDEGIEPDDVTFIVVLNTCVHGGLLRQGQVFFEMMSKTHEITPTEEHHTCIIDLLSRAGHLNYALAVMEKMSCSISLGIWENFLGACQKWGDINLGRWAFNHIEQLKGKDCASFVYMSNIITAYAKHEGKSRAI